MLSFKQFIQEHYLNLFSSEEKRKHVDEVKKLLDYSYASIGGIHGSGFKNHEDMIANIPMWKLNRRSGKIVSAILYKDTNGRKSVALGTDGSESGKHGLIDMMKNDVTKNRSYGEMSSKLLSFVKKHVGTEILKTHIIPFHEITKHLPNIEIRKPLLDDVEIIRHPEYAEHFYQRKIGGQWHTKLMIGQPGKLITPKKR